jgi:hypothetical protein
MHLRRPSQPRVRPTRAGRSPGRGTGRRVGGDARQHAGDAATWADREAHYDTATVIALMAASLCYRMAAGLFNSLGIELDEGVPGWPQG